VKARPAAGPSGRPRASRAGGLNRALPPCRELAPDGLAPDGLADGIAQLEAFAAAHGIGPGVQISPLELHGALDDHLHALGWSRQEPVLVMTAGAGAVAAGRRALPLSVSGDADDAWLDAWGICEPARDVESHVETVFALLRGRARFGRFGQEAVAIVVESDGFAGLFCLAVAPAARRRGLGSALVRGLLASCGPDVTAYVQVEGHNQPAIAMYDRLGFEVAYRYRHSSAPGVRR
jgi:N-acetylglutamate synthase